MFDDVGYKDPLSSLGEHCLVFWAKSPKPLEVAWLDDCWAKRLASSGPTFNACFGAKSPSPFLQGEVEGPRAKSPSPWEAEG